MPRLSGLLRRTPVFAIVGLAGFYPRQLPAASDGGLLFSLSADRGTTAEVSAGGTPQPNVVNDVSVIQDGANGPALSCAHTQVLAYWAPGNIYAQRGTLSFFWRSREEVGPTAFPIFRVAYADHSSWDMVWLRIDYNGHGFDAFVTDANLSRVRVSIDLPQFPKPNEWVHLALAWDEATGLRFFINGKLAAEKKGAVVLDAALDQFGPHSRIISPHQDQSDYNFVRGGDIDELRIYDHALEGGEVTALASARNGSTATTSAVASSAPARKLDDSTWQKEWALRYGWNRSDDLPPALPAAATVVRKVEIHDAYDLKRWWWKANDGIRETTWPGVYNRSRLPGRNDYFQLPDWDCYSVSGQAVTFTLPQEPWNYLELVGAAHGEAVLLKNTSGAAVIPVSNEPGQNEAGSPLFTRKKGEQITFAALAKPVTGGAVRFENAEQEEPIEEFGAYYVHAGEAPAGSTRLTYTLSAGTPASTLPALDRNDAAYRGLATILPGASEEWIQGRYPEDERQLVIARPAGAAPPSSQAGAPSSNSPDTKAALPLVHVLVPFRSDAAGYDLSAVDGGLDGVLLELPALPLKGSRDGKVAFNIRLKDPLWPLRDLIDYTFTAKPGQPISLWLDSRDRILPAGKNVYLTIASSAREFSRASLEGAKLSLVFKSRASAVAEHELDRFTQARDSYAMLVEERPHDNRFNLWNRFEMDLRDLLRVSPEHKLGLQYATAAGVSGFEKPAFVQPVAPEGVPLWAFRQVKLLEETKKFVLWYIDHRQIANGEFGGGISDDTDLLNLWPGLALMGAEPERVRTSSAKLLDASFANGMWTNGLSTIQTDELHSYEDGINSLAQNLVLDFGNPKQIERAMVTARGVAGITGVNTAGHRHVRSSYYSGSKIAEDSVWGYAKPYSYLVFHPGMELVEYNGNPEFKKIVVETADGLLAHAKEADGRIALPRAIHFKTDAEVATGRYYFPTHIFWTAYRWTGDKKYLQPMLKSGDLTLLNVNANVLDLLDMKKELSGMITGGEPLGPVETRSRGDVRPARARNAGGRETHMLHFQWQLTGDTSFLERLYGQQLERVALENYINTEGSLWIDRVGVPTAELQRARLGGIALIRNSLFSGNTVAWRFVAPARAESLGILVPYATATEFKVLAYNLENAPVTAELIGAQIDPGQWEISQSVEGKEGATASQKTVLFERSRGISLTFAPRVTTVLHFTLKTPGKPYHQRPDLGITRDDIAVEKGKLRVTVHSIGAVEAPGSALVVKDSAGKVIASGAIPALAAPTDLLPKTAMVSIALPANSSKPALVEIDPDHQLEEITTVNNRVTL